MEFGHRLWYHVHEPSRVMEEKIMPLPGNQQNDYLLCWEFRII